MSPGCDRLARPAVPTTPSLGSINLLELLIELRETVYSLDHQFVIKGYNSGRARCTRCLGRGVGKVRGAPDFLRMSPSPRFSAGSPARKPSKPFPSVVSWRLLAWVQLIKTLATDCWLHLQPLSPPQRSGGWDRQFQPCHHVIGSPGNQSPPSGVSKVTSFTQQKTP